jgi:hypothetical protein
LKLGGIGVSVRWGRDDVEEQWATARGGTVRALTWHKSIDSGYSGTTVIVNVWDTIVEFGYEA